jgi:hypothetical protein
VDLELVQRNRVLVEAEERLPGIVKRVAAALLTEQEAKAEQAHLRKEIQDAMPGDPVIHIFTAAKLGMMECQKQKAKGRPSP